MGWTETKRRESFCRTTATAHLAVPAWRHRIGRQRYRKVKAEAKTEVKNVRSSLNLDLDLSQSRAAILRGPDCRKWLRQQGA